MSMQVKTGDLIGFSSEGSVQTGIVIYGSDTPLLYTDPVPTDVPTITVWVPGFIHRVTLEDEAPVVVHGSNALSVELGNYMRRMIDNNTTDNEDRFEYLMNIKITDSDRRVNTGHAGQWFKGVYLIGMYREQDQDRVRPFVGYVLSEDDTGKYPLLKVNIAGKHVYLEETPGLYYTKIDDLVLRARKRK